METVLLWTSVFAEAAGVTLLAVLPCWLLVRRLCLDSLTTLSVAIVAGVTLSFALQFVAYLTAMPASAPAWVTAGLAAVVAVRLWRSREGAPRFPWAGVLTWFGVVVWTLGIQGQVVVYGGLGTYGDWFEHYERSLFFLEQKPPSTKFLGDYGWSLAARAPLFNAVAASHLGLFGDGFSKFQVITTVLNTMPVLPFALLCRDLAGLRERSALLLAGAVLALAPIAVHQQTFTWTKFCAFGFVMAGMHLYVRSLRDGSPRVLVTSFLVFAAAILVHYVAIGFAGLFALHFLVMGRRRAGGWPAVGVTGALCALVLVPWFAFIEVHLGLAEITATVGNKYARGRDGAITPRSEVALSNLVTTLIPCGWRHDWPDGLGAPPFQQFDPRGRGVPAPPSARVAWRDDLLSRTRSLLGMLGWAGLLALASLPFLRRRRLRDAAAARPPPGPWFWVMLFVVGIPLQIAATPYASPLGLGRLILAPYYLLILVFAAWHLALAPGWWRRSVLSFAVLESLFCLVLFLEFHSRTLPVQPWPGVPGRFQINGPLSCDPTYSANYLLKLGKGVELLWDVLGSSRIWFGVVACGVGALLIALAYLPRFGSVRSSSPT